MKNQGKMLDEKLRIYLTDQARGRPAGRVFDLSKQIMLSVGDFYNKPTQAVDFRSRYGLTDLHQAGWDSGGFQFLMGKLKGVAFEPLPCGIEVPVNASRTIHLYKKVGIKPQDLPIQLDLPPRWDLPPEHRQQLIEKSVLYYYEMIEEIPEVVPTIHGWTLEEIEYNLELVMDPDKAAKIPEEIVATGTFKGAQNNWTMGNLNPHDGKVAAGLFGAPGKSVVDAINGMWGRQRRKRKPVGVGSYKALANPTDYVLYTDNSANPMRDQLRKRVATAFPGALDLRQAIPLVDKVKSRIATPVPGKVDVGIERPDDQPQVAAPRKRIAAGTFSATGVVGRKRASYTVIIDRIAMVMNRLRDEYEIFMLGGASPHTQHQVFLAGARWTDTSAWRIKAVLGEIYLPEHSSGHNAFGVGYSQKTKRMDMEALEILKECLADPRHPFSGMYWKEFMEIAHMLIPKWKRNALKKSYPAVPFVLRALHNAYVLKCREEEIANEHINDPDRYHAYLKKRLSPRPILSKRLKALWNRLKHPYVQTDLRVYIKERNK